MFTSPEYPFQSKFFRIPHEPLLRLHYIEEGKGDPVVFVHGNPTWSFYFRKLISRFSKKHRCIAIDHLGMGLSSKPLEGDYSLADHIRRFGQFIDHLGLNKITLVVHDWGGAIGLGWAVEHPDRIKRIVITNTAAFNSTDVPKRISILKTPLLGEAAIRGLNAFALPATMMASARGLSPEAHRGLLYPYDTYASRIGIARFVQDIPSSDKQKTHELLTAIENKLGSLKVPTIILWGLKDFCFHPGFLERWRKIYPAAMVYEFPQGGHYLFEDEAEGCCKALENFFASKSEVNEVFGTSNYEYSPLYSQSSQPSPLSTSGDLS